MEQYERRKIKFPEVTTKVNQQQVRCSIVLCRRDWNTSIRNTTILFFTGRVSLPCFHRVNALG